MTKAIRREYMRKNFPEVSELDWCELKTACALRQLAYELGESQLATEIDSLVDEVCGHALGEDLTGCEACASDREI